MVTVERRQFGNMAVLICAHNRREVTLRSLRSLYRQCCDDIPKFDVFLVDDGSSDGTTKAVRTEFPHVNVFAGDGDLFWTGGTNLAWQMAEEVGFDYYLWLNDDVVLKPRALKNLFDQWSLLEKDGVLVGSMINRHGEVTYGGVRRASWWHKLRFDRVEPSSVLQECETFNGNLVFVPKQVFEKIGFLDSKLEHTGADFDYGLRLRAAGYSAWVGIGWFGHCERNSSIGGWSDVRVPCRKRFQMMLGKKGMPVRAKYRYIRRHGGGLWPVYFLGPYVKFLLSCLSVLGYKKS